MAELTISAADIASALQEAPRGLRAVARGPHRRARHPGRRRHRPRRPACPGAAVNELLEFEDGTVGLALNLDEDSIGAVVLGDVEGIEEGQTVKATGRILSVPVGDAMLGRVVNALGEPIDGKGPIVGRPAPPHGDPGAVDHGPPAGARAAADRHQGHRRHDARSAVVSGS